jgi:periplasmic protein CpxP/Spy
MKKILLTATVITLMGFAVQAQQKMDGPRPFHRQMHHRFTDLSKQLNFTDAQKQQFKSINQDFHQKMAALNKNEDIPVREWKQKKADLIKDHKSAFQNMLTPEQKTKLKEMRQTASAKFHQRSEKRLEKMKTQLNLSDDQVAKIKNISQDFRSQLKTIRENTAMDPTDKRSQIIALANQQRKDFKSVLTSEQVDKWEQWRKDREHRFDN